MRFGTVCSLALLALFAACAPDALHERVADTGSELLYDDIVEQQVRADQASFFGVSLGDSEQSVIDLHGEPSAVEDYQFGRVKNLEYVFGSDNQTDVLFHTEQGVVTAVLVTRNAEGLLSEDTLLGDNRTAVYGMLGVPTVSKDLYRERVFFYDSLGYEVYTTRRSVDRIYFTQPDRGLEPAGQDSNQTCAQVVTPARLGPECIEFPNPCVVPDDWTVVDSCENRAPQIVINQS